MPSKSLPLVIVSVDQGVPSLKSNYSFSMEGEILDFLNIQGLKEGDYFYLLFSNEEAIDISFDTLESATCSVGDIGYECRVKAKKIATLPFSLDAELHSIECFTESQVAFGKLSMNSRFLRAQGDKLHFNYTFLKKSSNDSIVAFIKATCSLIDDFPTGLMNTVMRFDSALHLSDFIAFHYFEEELEKNVYLQNPDETSRTRMVVTYLIQKNSMPKILDIYDAKAPEEKYIDISEPIYPQEVLRVLKEEEAKLDRSPVFSNEASALQNYIDTLKSYPWGIYSELNSDLHLIKECLSEKHYGLDDVKERIFEHIILENHVGSPVGGVLCFIGPPGTGKTSIAQSIANATGRKLVKIALGGVSDEAELRGHRRTYVSSKPGRIIHTIIKAGTNNPIILLDEVDKLSVSAKDNPAAALLELLDPEQNNHYIDRYMEVGVDLSQALFICTANYEEQIPPALKDRLEPIYFRYYSYEERLEIIKKHLLPSVLKKYKMESFNIKIEDSFIEVIAQEKSLRLIDKNLSKVLRSLLVEFKMKNKEKAILTSASVEGLVTKNKNRKTIGFTHETNRKC